MQDRFKFRGVLKLATQNIVIYSSFLKNYDDELVLSVEESYALKQIKDAGYELTDKDWDEIYRYSDQDDYYPWFNFSCERVDQCTGLKDKNGKLIYEGDILEVKVFDKKNYNQKKQTYWTVEWHEHRNNHGFMAYGINRRWNAPVAINKLFNAEAVVVGNIHENADLLGDKTDE